MAHGKPPIVDTGRKGEDLVNKMVLSEPSKISDHSLVLDSGNGLLDFDPSGGNDFVFGLLFCGELLSPRLLCGLNDSRVARCIAFDNRCLATRGRGMGKHTVSLRSSCHASYPERWLPQTRQALSRW